VTVTVDANPVAVFSAEELIDGKVDELSDGVPERSFDARDGRLRESSPAGEPGKKLRHVFGKTLDVVGILADEAGFEILDVLAERAGERFPDAGDPSVRFHGNDVPREVPTDNVTGDAGDFDIATRITRHLAVAEIAPFDSALHLRNEAMVFRVRHRVVRQSLAQDK